MALVATFAADISQFESAMKRGTASASDFDKVVAGATKSVKKEVDSFSGTKVVTETKRMSDASTGFTAILGKIGPAIAGAFTVGAVINAVRSFTDFTGKLSDLSAKTGISTSGLQKLQLAFAQSGVSIDTVTNAVTKLGQKLVGDDKAASNAMRQLGLSVEELKRIGPEQAFIKTADAVAKVENPMERARLAMDLWGRNGVEVLAGLDGNLAKTTASFERMGLILSDDVVKAGDKFGDTLTVLKAQGAAMLGQMLVPMLPALTKIAQGIGNLAQNVVPWLGRAFDTLTQTGLKLQIWFFDFMASMAEMGSKVPLLGRALGATSDATQLFKDKAFAARLELDQWTLRVPKVETATRKVIPVVGEYGEALTRTAAETKKAAEETRKAEEATKAFQSAVDFFGTRLDHVNHNAMQPYAAALSDVAAKSDIAAATLPVLASTTQVATRAMEEAWRATEKFVTEVSSAPPIVEKMTSSLSAAFKSIGPVIIGALQGGGSVIQSIGSHLGHALGNDMVKRFGENITKTLPKFLGDAINSLIPGVGALLGPLLGKIGGFFKNLFGGVSPEVKAARAEVEKFQAVLRATLSPQQRAGMQGWEQDIVAVKQAFMAAGRSAAEAEAIVRQLWDTDRPDKARQAIEEINKVLGLVNTEQEELNDAVERYGFTIEELGPTMQKQRLSEMATQLIRDFGLLTKSGIDVGKVTERMADEINEYLKIALKTGQEVPASMRPMLEKMIDMGLLTDEAGEKLTDLGRITWAETIRESTDRVVASIDRLADVLVGAFGKAGSAAGAFVDRVRDDLGRLPREIPIDVVGHYSAPDISGAPGFASGTRGMTGSWFHDFGGGSPAVLHGTEAVVPYADRLAFALDTLASQPSYTATAPSAPAVNVYVAVDPTTGSVRVMSDAERRTVQQWLSAGQLSIPQRIVSAR